MEPTSGFPARKFSTSADCSATASATSPSPFSIGVWLAQRRNRWRARRKSAVQAGIASRGSSGTSSGLPWSSPVRSAIRNCCGGFRRAGTIGPASPRRPWRLPVRLRPAVAALNSGMALAGNKVLRDPPTWGVFHGDYLRPRASDSPGPGTRQRGNCVWIADPAKPSQASSAFLTGVIDTQRMRGENGLLAGLCDVRLSLRC